MTSEAEELGPTIPAERKGHFTWRRFLPTPSPALHPVTLLHSPLPHGSKMVFLWFELCFLIVFVET